MGGVSDLAETVKLGRQSALLGEYAKSTNLFEEAISVGNEQLEKCSRESSRVEDSERREARMAVEKWRKVVKVLQKELESVRRVENLADATGGGARGRTSAGLKSSNNNKQVAQGVDKESPRTGTPQLAAAESQPVWKQQVRKAPQPAKAVRKSTSSTPGLSSAAEKNAVKQRGTPGDRKDKRKSYAEAMENSPDIELIRSIEGTMLTQDLQIRSEDIAGLQGAKTVLEEAVLFPQLMPSFYTGIRRPWKGVLLFGPPGTGKTMLAKAIASECKTCFFNVSSSSLTSKWRGESEKMMSILFDMARFYAPSTIFFDEIDSIASARGSSTEHEASRRVKSELLTQMDGVSGDSDKTVVVLAATNMPWDLDEALRRRLEKRIYIPLPELEGRAELFRLATRGVKLCEDVDFQQLAAASQGYSGADISNVCHEASMMPIRRLIEQAKRSVDAMGGGREDLHEKMKQMGANETTSPPVRQQDLLDALDKVQSSVGGKDLSRYQQWLEEFGAT